MEWWHQRGSEWHSALAASLAWRCGISRFGLIVISGRSSFSAYLRA